MLTSHGYVSCRYEFTLLEDFLMSRSFALPALILLAFLTAGTALAAPAGETGPILTGLFFTLFAALVGGAIVKRLGLPAVVGQVLAGIIVGPSAFGLVQVTMVNLALAELGAIFLLFTVGLETRLQDLLKVGRAAVTVAILGIAIPLALGYGFGVITGRENLTSLFIGTALVATSVGITAKVLQELGVLNRTYAQIILGAAVIDDILGLTILAVVSGMGKGGFSSAALAATLGLSVGFVALVLLVGVPLVARLAPRIANLSLSGAFTVAITVGLGLAALSVTAGLAPIIGAFLAGMILAEVKDEADFEGKVHAVEAFLAPVFFVMVGAQLDLKVLMEPGVLVGGLVLSALAVIGKYVGGWLGARGLPRAEASIVGLGMVPRGEVGLIVASLGLALGFVQGTVYAQVLVMVLVTTILAPILLRILVQRHVRSAERQLN